MQPLRDLLLIKLDEKQEKTAAGLLIQEAWKGPVSSATIENVGPEANNFKKGDRVIINPYAVIDLPETADKLIKEGDILCRVV